MKYLLQLTCLAHVPEHSSDECKVLGDFGSKYTKGIPTKDLRQEPATKKTIRRQKENNAIVQN